MTDGSTLTQTDNPIKSDRTGSGKEHFEVLDGLRGSAAILIVVFHAFNMSFGWDTPLSLLHHAYLAVDFYNENPDDPTDFTDELQKYNADGSLTLYFQNASPGKDLENNWLPAPTGQFIPMLRMYWPKPGTPSVLNGTWAPPAIKRVD